MSKSFRADEAAPAKIAFAITKSDTTAYSGIRGVYVGGGGDVAILDNDGNTTTFVAVPTGTVLPVCAVKIMSTNTTATNIVLLK